ncbi:MAG: LysM peptidoglycan-binding domain-containing protein [Treponema sp.]|jgi:nucleoid-associated protein YgaU|nr:LysM peptidoglycan-binding domain-containing protein [Treponema sp.]
MRCYLIPGLLLVLGLPLFGDEISGLREELPEPVLRAEATVVAAEAETGVFRLPDFDEAVRYLWNLGGLEPLNFEYIPLAAYAAAADADGARVPGNLRNNQYFVESVRLTNLASESFEFGDYDASTKYAEEALEYARRSDEYVALQLKIQETNDSIAAAHTRLEWAASVNAESRFPQDYRRARASFDEALNLRKAENWNGAIDAAHAVINALAFVTDENLNALPAQYTVRPWAVSRDCLWNIAGRPWAYGDPAKWRLLYNANRARMPQPDNPDLIHPGMILDIPSINGEIRQGLWEADRTYTPLR